MTSSHRVRNKAQYHASGTSRTITFDEGTPLDSTHLLVCIVQHSSQTAVATPTDWTLAGSASTATPAAMQLRVFIRQGDGTANSVTLTTTNVAGAITLIGYTGYTSLTPIAAMTNFIVSTAVNPWAFPDLATVTGDGVALNLVSSGSAIVQSSVTGGWGAIPNAGAAGGRLGHAEDDYAGGASDESMSFTFSATRSGMGAQIVLPLVTAAVTHDAAGSVDVVTESSGDVTAAFDVAGVVDVITDSAGDLSLSADVSGAVEVVTTTSGAATIVVPGVTHVIEAVAWDYSLLAGG